ncbi:hypothetical protein MPDQ_005786 [Monascus purpureus]|uniref:Uncharacterized protein n=1 Tax=Monascus purpureus TaxID=5098 RepID=A0A507QW55_MONPU|nr:hypothetical protein MPDQ_005786 [Monascus purpureus]BDD55218.1 hypothetical protein MAP00_000763 [Monascus purpureus]
MGRFGILSLALLSFQALIGSGLAADTAKKAEEKEQLAVTAQATFPAASEIFGVKLVNGHPTEAVITFTNNEPAPVTVNFVGGSLWSLEEKSSIVRNLTTTRYGVEIPAGEKQSLSYSFATEMHPQDLRLNLVSLIFDGDGAIFSLPAFNGTVSVVEPETSIFDPQILFLYFFLLTCLAGVVYFFYTVWIAPYLPQKRRGGKGDFSKKASEKKDSTSQSVDGTNPTAASTTVYNAEWIPAHHINRPEPRKVKGASRSKSRA